MKEVFSHTKSVSFDHTTWSNQRHLIKPPDYLVSVPINFNDLEQVNKHLWGKYEEMIKEVPDFFEEFEETFPAHDKEILENPLILNELTSKSDYWANMLVEGLSVIQHWNHELPEYEVFNFTNFYYHENVFYAQLLALKLSEVEELVKRKGMS